MVVQTSLETLVSRTDTSVNTIRISDMCIRRPASSVVCWVALVVVFSLPMFARAQTVGLVVSGLGGENKYSESFGATADAFVNALESLDSAPGVYSEAG